MREEETGGVFADLEVCTGTVKGDIVKKNFQSISTNGSVADGKRKI